MSISTWLRREVFGRNSDGRANRRQQSLFRPELESLDDRLVPSTLHVTNNLDFGPGSLRYEVAHASSNGRDKIVFDKAVWQHGLPIHLGTELKVTNGMTIQGPGAGLLTLTTNYNWTDSWGQSIRAIEVDAGKPVTISGLAISDNGGTLEGGAILNHSTLTLSGCDITHNYATNNGGGIANYGTLTISSCTLANNVAGNGGGIYNAGTLTLTGSTLSSYSIYNEQSALFDGGAIYNAGTSTISNCTLSDNAAFIGGAIYNSGLMTVNACTFTDNFAYAGGAIETTGQLTLSNSVFTGNSLDNIFGPYIDGGGNIFG